MLCTKSRCSFHPGKNTSEKLARLSPIAGIHVGSGTCFCYLMTPDLEGGVNVIGKSSIHASHVQIFFPG